MLSILPRSLTVACLGVVMFAPDVPAQNTPPPPRISLILDTDIGDDIDDSWTLVQALKNPRFDIKLVTTTYGEGAYRADMVAKYLMAADRTDIPIGVGPGPNVTGERMRNWLDGFTVANYQGKVIQDGAQAMVDTINASPTPITVVANGPLNTVGAALRKDPGIAAKAIFVGMQGSVRVGYDGSTTPVPEYNVHREIPGAKAAFAAPWRRTAFAPLDTAGAVTISGERYDALARSDDKLLRALILNNTMAHGKTNPSEIHFSGTCFDEVGLLLAEPDAARFVRLEKLKIVVTDIGMTAISPEGREMDVATAWKDKAGFLSYLARNLLGRSP